MAKLLIEGMAYQISKYIGAMAAVLKGAVDKIIITGGMAYSKLLTALITDRVSFLAGVAIHPGEDEMRALAEGCLRVLKNEEAAKEY